MGGARRRSTFYRHIPLPKDWRFPVFLQILIGAAEVLVSEETVVGGEGRRMCRGEDEMSAPVDEGAFALGIRSPQDKYQVLFLFCQDADDGIREGLPTMSLV